MKKATTSKKLKAPAGLPLVHSNAAGIDIGDTLHAVAVPEGRDEQQVRTFGAMTCDLLVIAGLSARHLFSFAIIHEVDSSACTSYIS